MFRKFQLPYHSHKVQVLQNKKTVKLRNIPLCLHCPATYFVARLVVIHSCHDFERFFDKNKTTDMTYDPKKQMLHFSIGSNNTLDSFAKAKCSIYHLSVFNQLDLFQSYLLSS